MDPNTNNQPNPSDLAQQSGMPQPQPQLQPQPQVMPQQMVPPQPVAAPIQQPVMPQMPQAPLPMQPQPQVMPQQMAPSVQPMSMSQPPAMPQPQMTPSNSYVQPGAMMPPMPAQAPAMQSANSGGFAKGGGKKRKILIAFAALLAAALLAGGAWFGFQQFASAPLKTSTYEGEDYSILYPSEGWEKKEIGDNVTFSKDVDGNYESSIVVEAKYVGETTATEEDAILKKFSETFTKESLDEADEDMEITNFESKIHDNNGKKEFIASGKIKENNTEDGVIALRAFVANKKLYFVFAGVYKKTDKALHNNLNVVIDSFKAK